MKYIKLYAYLNGNLGDDLMVEILLKRYPNYQFIYMGKADDYKPLAHYDNLITKNKLKQKWNTLNRVLNALTRQKKKHFFVNHILHRMQKKAICSVHIGGSIFIEHSSAAVQVEQEKEKMNGAPLFIIGANFGPYIHQEFLNSFRICFRDVADICFRDLLSYQLFSELPNVRYAPDVVFNYPCVAKKNVTNEVVISVINFHSRPTLLPYAEQYDRLIADVCRACVNRSLKPVLVSFCKNEGDEAAVERIYSILSETVRENTQIVHYQKSNTLIKRFAAAKFIVATRFHAMILALLFHVPFYSIAYDYKIANVLDDIGCAAYCTPENIGSLQASDILDEKQALLPIDQIVLEANKQFEGLDRFLLKGL